MLSPTKPANGCCLTDCTCHALYRPIAPLVGSKLRVITLFLKLFFQNVGGSDSLLEGCELFLLVSDGQSLEACLFHLLVDGDFLLAYRLKGFFEVTVSRVKVMLWYHLLWRLKVISVDLLFDIALVVIAGLRFEVALQVPGHLALLERGVLDLLWPLAFKLLGISLFPSQEFGGLVSINFTDFVF